MEKGERALWSHVCSVPEHLPPRDRPVLLLPAAEARGHTRAGSPPGVWGRHAQMKCDQARRRILVLCATCCALASAG